MAQEINLGGTIYISSKRAAEITGYAQDYIGQLARMSAIEAKRISGLWYVLEDSIRKHKEKADEYVPQPPQPTERAQEAEVTLSLDGRDYASASRAAKLTGYTQDYVGQLARSGQILSRQIGNRWYVDRAALMDHKKTKDSLLAAVQRNSVGLAEADHPAKSPLKEEISADRDTHFKYISEGTYSIPPLEKEEDRLSPEADFQDQDDELKEKEVNQIPIRVIARRRGQDDRFVPSPGYEGTARSRNSKKGVIIAAAGSLIIGVLVLVSYLGVSGVISIGMPRLGLARNDLNTGYLGNNLVIKNIGDTLRQLAANLLSKELFYRRGP